MLNKIITMLRISEVFRQKRPFLLKRIENKIELFYSVIRKVQSIWSSGNKKKRMKY